MQISVLYIINMSIVIRLKYNFIIVTYLLDVLLLTWIGDYLLQNWLLWLIYKT